MTQASEATDLAGAAGWLKDARIIGLVGAAHFVSHVYLIVLPPLFLFIRADYGTSYEGLAFAIAAFNIVSTMLQPPAGFLVDRMAPATLLVSALALGASGLALAALVPSYWALVAGWAIAGVANTIYHPADYAILSDRIRSARISQAFSFHTFFGMLGTAATPAAMLFLADRWGWRGAVLGAAALGYVVALVLVQQRTALGEGIAAARMVRRGSKSTAGWSLLLSAPILRNVLFFILLSGASSGIYGFSIVALGALYGTKLAAANLALTAFLFANAAGVLAGGFVAQRVRRHDRVAIAGFGASGLAILVVALVPLGTTPLVLTLALAGFLNGIILPSRDMIVRAVTPPGAFGTVFGFVSTGFSIAAVIGPLLFGRLMDAHQPRLIFLLVVAFTFLALPLVRQKSAAAPG
ncbi:MAG TPA: MFS transporter [Stellaceae bacterium]|nr:MFS transporter [Stellaceae bacterium]